MIVADASALFNLLTVPRPAELLSAAIEDDEVHAPALIDFEVGSAIRGHLAGGYLDESEAFAALARLQRLTIHRYGGAALLTAVLGLRHNFTAYDAVYIVLSQILDAPLVTADAKLLEARRLGVDVRVIA